MNFKKIISWGMIASVFMDDFIIAREKLPFDFYVYYLIFIVSISYYIIVKGTLKLIPKWFFFAIGLLIISTFYASFASQTYGFGVIKQLIGIVFTSIAYYTFIAYNDFDIKKIFKMYLFAALLLGIYGVYEEFLHLNGIHISHTIRKTNLGFYRIYTIMGEPYFVAVVLIPALHFFFNSTFKNGITNNKLYALIIISIVLMAYVFTFSSAGAIGLFLFVIFYFYNKNFFSFKSWKLMLLPFILLTLYFSFGKIKDEWKEFNIKTTQTITAFTKSSLSDKEKKELNSSSFALYSNFLVASSSFKSFPLTGTGLGTHENSYKKRFTMFFSEDFMVRFGLFNVKDANSLFLRLMSETGLLGLSMFFIFLFKYFLRKNGLRHPETKSLTLMNQGIFIWFLVRLVRTGNYFGNGFFLFFFIYYFSAKIVRKKWNEIQRNRISQLKIEKV